MEKQRKAQKKKSAAVSVLLIVCLLIAGTYAWKNNLLHKTTTGAKDARAILKSVQLVDESQNVADWEVGKSVKKRLFVKNDGADGSGGGQRFEDVYVRITLKEYMERLNAGQEQYPNRLMIDKDGNFITLPNSVVGADAANAVPAAQQKYATAVIANGNYKGRIAVALTDVLGSAQAQKQWYIETAEGDQNGQYGNFMVIKLAKSVQHILAGQWKDGSAKAVVPNAAPQTPGDYHTDGATDECKYKEINWKGVNFADYQNPQKYNDDNTKEFRKYVELALGGSDKVRFISDYFPGSGSPHANTKLAQGAYWLIDDLTDMCAYWMQALNPKATTADFTTDMKLVESPNGKDPQGDDYPLNFYYALHADLDPTLAADHSTDWPGMRSDIEQTLFPKKFVFKLDTRLGNKGNAVELNIAKHYENDYTIEWGDGNKDSYEDSTWNSSPATRNKHTYAAPGEYTVEISGDLTGRIIFKDEDRLTEVVSGSLPKNTTNGMIDQFNGCINLKSIPAELFANVPVNSSFSRAFKDCSSLRKVPRGLFDSATRTLSFISTFNGCSSLREIPQGLFDKNIAVTTFQFTFCNCSSLREIPQGLFDKNVKVTEFPGTFTGCSSLTQVPQGLFDHNPLVKTFFQVFTNCFSLRNIPQGLFDANTEVTTFERAFRDCGQLLEIPQGLFDHNTKVTNFECVFWRCYSVKEIPQGLFDHNTAAENFNFAFTVCKSLKQIPQGLFDYNTAAKSFLETFGYCDQVTQLPNGLFDNNKNATNFYGVFCYCTSLKNLPQGLFDKNTAAKDFSLAFDGCEKLEQIPQDIFAHNNAAETFVQTFRNCKSITGNLPELWVSTTTKFPNLSVGLATTGLCFANCDSASNWASVPAEWR